MSLCRTLNRVSSFLYNLNLNYLTGRNPLINRFSVYSESSAYLSTDRQFHSSCVKKDLMEFFDDKKNWGEREVLVGRSWKLDELRIKSNSDLHKLWYVLLKERNMLLTMQHEYEKNYQAFPNPERLDKVEESMENLEAVVRERNRAYHELETGENGERPKGEAVNCFGLTYTFKKREHTLEKRFNKSFLAMERLHNKTDDHFYIRDFLTRLKEKQRNIELARQSRRYKIVCGLLKRFPNVDEEALKQEYPDVDIEKAKKDKLSRGHRLNQY